MYDFYWYPKCSTCRKAKAFLEAKKISLQTIDLTQTPPTKSQFLDWFERFPMKKFFNTSGQVYRGMQLKDRMNTLSANEAAELLSQHGMLIKRPLLVAADGRIVQIGFKESEYQKIK